jgi:hypothetical protein
MRTFTDTWYACSASRNVSKLALKNLFYFAYPLSKSSQGSWWLQGVTRWSAVSTYPITWRPPICTVPATFPISPMLPPPYTRSTLRCTCRDKPIHSRSRNSADQDWQQTILNFGHQQEARCMQQGKACSWVRTGYKDTGRLLIILH